VPNFKYVAVDPNGVKISGVLDAATAIRARNELITRELHVVEVRERKRFTKVEITKKKVKPADLMNFSRQLAAFLRAGIPILDALHALTDEVTNPVLKRVLVDVADALRSGSTLSEAMGAHSALFPTYYVGILHSAELTGNLDTVLDQLSEYIERDLEARRAVKSALTYPIVIFFMAVITVSVLVSYVLPKFEKFFSSFDATLPLPTRILLSSSRFLGKWWMFIALGALVFFILNFLFLRTPRGRLARDRFLLRVPVLGDVVRYAVIERFCRILGAMLRAGVPVPEAMGSASVATNNRVYQLGLDTARQEMLRGEGLATPIAETHLFPGAATQMLRVGEESGTLEQQLEIAADFYEAELGYKLKRLTTLFEPVVIMIMGLIVGFVAVALVSAMYGIFNQVKVQ
jgi:type IV pilus assembly protein PilC